MRTLIILLGYFFFVTAASAQKDSIPPPPPPYDNHDSNEPIFTKVEVEAEFPGGLDGWKKFLMTNLDVDGVAKKVKVPRGKKEVMQTVIVKFIVSKSGHVSNIAVENECDPAFIEEAIRVIKKISQLDSGPTEWPKSKCLQKAADHICNYQVKQA